MKTIFRLAKTELRILFCSPVSWLILVIFAFQAGLNFSDTFGGLLKRGRHHGGDIRRVYRTVNFHAQKFISLYSADHHGTYESGIKQRIY